jgi:hypothetical protein
MMRWHLTYRTLAIASLLGTLAACGPSRLAVSYRIPDPQLVALPLTMGLRLPPAFTAYVQKELINDSQVEISLGATHTDALRRVAERLFTRAVIFEDAPPPDIGALHVLEPALLDYVYVFPAKGSDFYSVTITYKVTLHGPDNTELGTWEYAGYGSVPSRRTGRSKGMLLASAAAIRDASANFAAHLQDQPMIRSLLDPSAATAPAAVTAPAVTAPEPAADATEEDEGDSAPAAGDPP